VNHIACAEGKSPHAHAVQTAAQAELDAAYVHAFVGAPLGRDAFSPCHEKHRAQGALLQKISRGLPWVVHFYKKTPPRDARWLRHSIAVVFGGQICALPAGRSAEAAGEVAMTTRDPRIDAYVAKAAPFAQPIIEHVRKLATKPARMRRPPSSSQKARRCTGRTLRAERHRDPLPESADRRLDCSLEGSPGRGSTRTQCRI
jgi:hypothetical protein